VSSLHNAITRGQLNAAVLKALGIVKGDEEGLSRFSETLQAIIDPWSQPEWNYLRGDNLFAINVGSPLIAAELSMTALVNPAGSGLVVVLEKATAGSTLTLQTMGITIQTEAVINATLASSGTGLCRDTRRGVGAGPPNPQSRAVVRIGSDPAILAAALEQIVPPAGTFGAFALALPIVLLPGTGAVISGNTVNLGIATNYGWRERSAFKGELPA